MCSTYEIKNVFVCEHVFDYKMQDVVGNKTLHKKCDVLGGDWNVR